MSDPKEPIPNVGDDRPHTNASNAPHTASDAASDADALAADPLAQAQAEIVILQAKVSELNDHWLRGQAEVQNARRRADEEVSKARKFALESFAESLLPVLDSLEAGLQIKEATPEQLREGADATLRQLKAALERNKVIEINPAPTDSGSGISPVKFDPAKHQAISVVPAEQEANTVVAVLQKGYSIAERTLRPALVTVAAPK